MKSSRLPVFALLCIGLFLSLSQSVEGKDEWIQVRSKNFFLIGNASEKDIRKVGTRLEQFRETFRQVFGSTNLTSPIPTNVVVFKSGSSYKNFKPKRADGKIDTGVAGYFQPGEDVNYITLSTEGEDAQTYSVIFHEYVHFIVSTNFGKSEVPAWFNEGLAEYYETFQIEDDQKVKLGLLNANHLATLRQSTFMPLDTLFNTSNRQLHNTGDHSRHIFYAQSWALMHFLLQSGKTEGLGKFLNALSGGIAPERAFQEAFQTNYDKMESDLRKYVGQGRYNYNLITFQSKLLFDAAMTVEPLYEASTNAYLGDLLYHTNRHDDAEPFLLNALKAQPDSSMANTTLGMVKIRQRKFDDAKIYLEKAMAGDSKNHMALYRYAYLLSREGRDEFGMVRSFEKETTAKMRAALNKAIALNPAFTESYDMLAFVNLVNNEELDASIKLLRTALRYQPGNQKYAIRIAEILSRQNKLTEAGEIAGKIVLTADDEEITSRARSILDYVTQRRAFEARQEEAKKRYEASGAGVGRPPPPLRRTETDKPPTEAELAKRQAEANLRSINQALRKPVDGEKRVIGSIQKIDCKTRPIGFVIKGTAETFTVTSKDFQGLTLNAFDSDSSNAQVGCDENIAAYHAVITYRATPAAKGSIRGELTAIEFVPADFRLMTDEEMASGSYVVYEEPKTATATETSAPRQAPPTVDRETIQRAAMLQAMRNALNVPRTGEKREMGFLDRIECTKKGIYFHIRTTTQTLRLLNSSPESLPIRLFTPDLQGLEFGCTLKPVEFPSVFIYTDKPDPKAKTAGEIVSIDFVPKTFVLD